MAKPLFNPKHCRRIVEIIDDLPDEFRELVGGHFAFYLDSPTFTSLVAKPRQRDPAVDDPMGRELLDVALANIKAQISMK